MKRNLTPDPITSDGGTPIATFNLILRIQKQVESPLKRRAVWSGERAGKLSFKIVFETKERLVTETAIRQALDKTRVFAERQRLFKELWRTQCALAVQAKEAKPPQNVSVSQA